MVTKDDAVPVTQAEEWLRAISDWLLANGHDMTLPSGVLDTDPLDIADALARHRGSTAGVDVEKELREGLEAARQSSPGFRIKVLSDTIVRVLASLSQTPATPMVQEGLRGALAYVGHLATCKDGHAHYCPTCDRSLGEICDVVDDALTATPAQEGEAERCRKCGHGNPSWSTPSPLWNAVIRGGSIDGEPLFGDMVCASCFMEMAEQAGIASNWRVDAKKVDVPLETTTSTGRVWDAEQWLWVHADEATPAPPVDETDRRQTIDEGLATRFRSALRFAASHSVISSADEQSLIAALADRTQEGEVRT